MRHMKRPIEPGQTTTFRTQTYECTGYAPHVLRDGRTISMCHLKTACPNCGTVFQLKATISNARKRVFRRRCDACKAPGVPVEFRMPKRNRLTPVKVELPASPPPKQRAYGPLKKILRPRQEWGEAHFPQKRIAA